MTESLLCFHDVAFAYDAQRPVLSGCSFALRSGERAALTGANGSGKTTLLHLAMGLIFPAAGAIEVFGKPRVAERDFAEVRGRVGLVFQDADDQLFCPTVEEDVAFGPLNLGRKREDVRAIVQETLRTLGLDGFAQRLTHRLSGGEKRLVALATVLAMQPAVLLLDEPTAGLDRAAVERLCAALSGLRPAMLIASHDAAFCAALGCTPLLLHEGRILAERSTS